MTGIDGSLKYVQLKQTTLDARLSKLQQNETAEAGGATQSDRVTLSAQATELLIQQVVVEKTLLSSEEGDKASEPLIEIDLFEQAGKTDYLERIANPTDLSSEATADRILGGITGYIYGAFKLGAPEANEEDFEAFFEQVNAGFEQGLEEAMEILEGMAALDDELTAAIQQTAQLVREGLASFHETEAAKYRSDEGGDL